MSHEFLDFQIAMQDYLSNTATSNAVIDLSTGDNNAKYRTFYLMGSPSRGVSTMAKKTVLLNRLQSIRSSFEAST